MTSESLWLDAINTMEKECWKNKNHCTFNKQTFCEVDLLLSTPYSVITPGGRRQFWYTKYHQKTLSL